MKNKTVLLFGTFDILHPGHAALFKQARRLGNKIVVILAKDATVKKIKKHLPVFSEYKRKKALKKTGWVNTVRLGSLRDKFQAIKKIKPDIICLGYDQTCFVEKLKEKLKFFKLHTKIIRLKPFKPNLYKSTLLSHYVGHQIYPRTRARNKKK